MFDSVIVLDVRKFLFLLILMMSGILLCVLMIWCGLLWYIIVIV